MTNERREQLRRIERYALTHKWRETIAWLIATKQASDEAEAEELLQELDAEAGK